MRLVGEAVVVVCPWPRRRRRSGRGAGAPPVWSRVRLAARSCVPSRVAVQVVCVHAGRSRSLQAPNQGVSCGRQLLQCAPPGHAVGGGAGNGFWYSARVVGGGRAIQRAAGVGAG